MPAGGAPAADTRHAVVAVICGPTAAGKSALALRLATRVGGVIVSADSRQIYRGFDVGTAKATPDERRRVPHYGIDVAGPEERWSAARWAEAAEGWMADARREGRAPLVVGGTGFYLRALAAPLFEEPPLDAARRAALQAELERLPVDALRRWTARLDPARAHLGRTQLLRALEVALLTGRRLSDLHAEHARPPRVRLRYLVVDPGPPLGDRIAGRVHDMLAHGWLDEVRRLAARVPPDAPAWQGTGYAELRRHLAGELTLDEAVARTVVDTRQYAKRQRTWFRHQLPGDDVVRVNPDDPRCDAITDAWWRATPNLAQERA